MKLHGIGKTVASSLKLGLFIGGFAIAAMAAFTGCSPGCPQVPPTRTP